MGMSLGGGGDRSRPMSEINVTPLVDIMLVLLIIFMVAAPLMSTGVEVDLPNESTKAMSTDKEPLVVSVSPDGKVYLEDRPISLEELVAKASALHQTNPNLPVYVRGDKTAAYGAVIAVMSRLQQAGVDKVGLVTEPR